MIESVELEPGERGEEVLVARVRVKAGAARRCSRCDRRCPGYDTSAKPRRWRGMDLGSTRVYLQATTCRVSCPEHGVVVAAVPWARAGSRFTRRSPITSTRSRSAAAPTNPSLELLFVAASYACYLWVRTYIERRRGLNQAELRRLMEQEIERFVAHGYSRDEALAAVLAVSKAVAADPPSDTILTTALQALNGK